MIIQVKRILIFSIFLMMPGYVYSGNYIHTAEGWLNNINSMTADFIQVSSDGGYAEGKLFIKKIMVLDLNMLHLRLYLLLEEVTGSLFKISKNKQVIIILYIKHHFLDFYQIMYPYNLRDTKQTQLLRTGY